MFTQHFRKSSKTTFFNNIVEFLLAAFISSIGSGLDPNQLTLIVLLKFFEFLLEKSVDENKSMKNYPACK